MINIISGSRVVIPNGEEVWRQANPLKMLFQETYLPAEYLPNLKKYHYCGQDNSILSAIFFTRMWNVIVDYLPMNLAPNMITFIGFSLSLGCYLLLMLFTPLMDTAAPSWVYL
jgi:ethanolaminephosphotransferase